LRSSSARPRLAAALFLVCGRGEDAWADDFEYLCRFTTTERTDGHQNGDASPAAYSRPVSFARTRRSSTRASHIEI